MTSSTPDGFPPPSPTPPRPRGHAPSADRRHLPALAGIGAIMLAGAGVFAATAGWFGQRLTAPRILDAMEANGEPHPGYRRNHAKGVCVTGFFEGTADGRAISTAPAFAGARVPVLGRFSIGGDNPHAADNTARVRSMALQLGDAGGPQWRMAMNSFPFFAVATPEAFLQQVQAGRPDPATGQPDPAAMEAFLAGHPRARAFKEWAKQAPWPTSWANTRYNSVNAFRFIDGVGTVRHVRWSMRPHTPFQAMDAATRAGADAGFLADDLLARLAQRPLRWDMVVTIAAPDDAVEDPTRPWPDTREQVLAGTLTLLDAAPQASGECRDVNFDPLVLPPGVDASDDPILAARSAVYAHSFNRRLREVATGASFVGEEQAR